MRTLDAELTAALESGVYEAYFNVQIIDIRNGTAIVDTITTGYKLGDLSIEITIESASFIDVNYFQTRLKLSRGVTAGEQNYALDTSDFFIIDTKWDGSFQTFTCHLFPENYYTADGDLTYREVIEAFCIHFDKTATFLDDSADWLDYQFLPDGRTLTLNNAQRFFTLLRQKHFIFATDNGGNEVLFYAAWQNIEDPQYTIDAYGFDVNYRHQHRRQYLWRDENETVHRTGATYNLIGQLGSETYILSLAELDNGIILAGTYKTGALGAIYRSTDYGQTWTLVKGPTYPVYALVYLGNGVALAGTSNGQVFRSTNYGATWAVLSTTQAIISMIFLENDIMLMGMNGFGRIYRSTNSGQSWPSYYQLPSDSGYVWALAYLGDGIVLAGVQSIIGGNPYANIYRSTDYGLTWTLIQQLGTQEKTLSLLDLGGGIVLAGTEPTGQIWRSTDYGLTWTLAATLDSETSAFHLSTFGYGLVIAGTAPGGLIYQSLDNGLTWTLAAELGTETDIRATAALTNGTFLAGSGPTGQVWRSENADAALNPVHNLGFMPSTATEPTKYSHPRPPKFAPFPVHLKYQSSDVITVNLLPTAETYDLLCAEVIEELNLDYPTLPWRMTISDTQWLTNTEGGALPSTIEAAAPYTPLNTSKFNKILDETINNLQALAEAVDEHRHGVKPSLPTYTPILTNVTNVTASVLNADFIYLEYEDIVIGSGSLQIDPTAAGTAQVDFTLPIASDLVTSYDLNGNVTSPISGLGPGSVIAEATNNRASVVIYSPDGANRFWRILFAYRVI